MRGRKGSDTSVTRLCSLLLDLHFDLVDVLGNPLKSGRPFSDATRRCSEAELLADSKEKKRRTRVLPYLYRSLTSALASWDSLYRESQTPICWFRLRSRDSIRSSDFSTSSVIWNNARWIHKQTRQSLQRFFDWTKHFNVKFKYRSGWCFS